jgi:fructokinase
MLCTDAEGDICLFSPSVIKKYPVNKIETVSTIGAGDNFNAGIVFGLMQEGIGRDDVDTISEEQWDRIIAHGQTLAAEVCQSFNNSISKEFAKNYGRK